MFNTLHAEWSLIQLSVVLHLPYAILSLATTTAILAIENSPEAILLTVGIQAIAVLLNFPLQFAQLFIVDQGDSLPIALGKSCRFVMKAPLKILWLMIWTALVGLLGAFACLVGLLVTIPIQILSLVLIYEDNRVTGAL